jgi:uncharacterized C2H2 Zn-finger protein
MRPPPGIQKKDLFFVNYASLPHKNCVSKLHSNLMCYKCGQIFHKGFGLENHINKAHDGTSNITPRHVTKATRKRHKFGSSRKSNCPKRKKNFEVVDLFDEFDEEDDEINVVDCSDDDSVVNIVDNSQDKTPNAKETPKCKPLRIELVDFAKYSFIDGMMSKDKIQVHPDDLAFIRMQSRNGTEEIIVLEESNSNKRKVSEESASAEKDEVLICLDDDTTESTSEQSAQSLTSTPEPHGVSLGEAQNTIHDNHEKNDLVMNEHLDDIIDPGRISLEAEPLIPKKRMKKSVEPEEITEEIIKAQKVTNNEQVIGNLVMITPPEIIEID